MAFGRLRRSCSALAVNSQSQFIFDFGPWTRLALASLLEALAQPLRLRRGKRVVSQDNPSGLHQNAVAMFGECDEVPRLEIERLENRLGNDYLAARANSADRLVVCWGCLPCHALRLSDCEGVSSRP